MGESLLDYESVERYLMNALPMYQRDGASAYKESLETSFALDAFDGHPHLMYRSIHVAGTNGKGSVSHMLCSVLMALGYRVGLFTSPHLVDYRERIRVDGRMIDPEYVVRYVQSHRSLFDHLSPSFFEMSAALAFNYFADMRVDFAVIETGMGGRLDSTNIISPHVSVITNISYDHMVFLGDTLEKIASEKAGIIKHGRPVVVGDCNESCREVFSDRAEKMGSPIRFASQIYRSVHSSRSDGQQILEYDFGTSSSVRVAIDLMGRVQAENVATVLCTLDVLSEEGLQMDEGSVRLGLAQVQLRTGLRGRWEVLQEGPLVVCDTGHNAAGLQEVVRQIDSTPHALLHAVVGFVNDKAISDMLALLPVDAKYYWTKASVPRALASEELEELAAEHGLYGRCSQTVEEALSDAMASAGRDDMVFVGGSTFVVADALRAWENRWGRANTHGA